MSFTVIDAKIEDYKNIAYLAEKNNLLLEDLDCDKFIKLMKWLYSNTPAGDGIQLIALDNNTDQIISHYGGTPFKVKNEGGILTMCVASNLVVQAGIRVPIFFLIQKKFISEYRKRSYSFAFASVTRSGIVETHAPLGWEVIGCNYVWVKPINFGSILNKMVGFNISKIVACITTPLQFIYIKFFNKQADKLKVEEVTHFGPDFEQFLNTWSDEQKVCTVPDCEVLNWRYFLAPNRNYKIFVLKKDEQIRGYVSTRKMIMKNYETIAILELVTLKDDFTAANALLSACTSYSKKENVDLIATSLKVNSLQINLYKRNGFIKTSQNFKILSHQSNRSDKSYCKNLFKDWNVTWFEHDYV